MRASCELKVSRATQEIVIDRRGRELVLAVSESNTLVMTS